VYYKIGVLYGNPKATPGGTGTPFQSSVRLDLVTGSKLQGAVEGEDEDEEKKFKKGAPYVGIETHITVAKNRLCPPFGKTTIEIMFDSGVDKDSGLLEVLERSRRIVKTGKGIYSFGEKTFKTSEFKKFLEENRSELLK
jgi:recombination protein RecA